MDISFRQVKIGAVLSYILIIFNMAYSLWLTPFLLKNLGVSEYGLYKLVGSLSGALIVLNFGVGDTVQKYLSLYISKREEKKISNLLGMFFILSIVLCMFLLVIGICMIYVFPFFYSNTLPLEQIDKAKILLVILIINMIITVLDNFFSGILAGYNDFICINSLKLVSIILRAILIYFSVLRGLGSVGLVLSSLLVCLATLIVEILYVYKRKKVVIRLEKWDNDLFKESGKYAFLMFLTMLSSQAFLNVDNIVIGAYLGTSIVSLYSLGLFFFDLFQQLSCAISGVMLPTITCALNGENGREKAISIVINAGRMQFLLLGAAFAGIVCVGKEFIYLWLGRGYENVYILILVLVGPSLFELCTNVCLSILRAENKITFRTYLTFSTAVINAVLTVLLVKNWSYMGAAVATAVSYVLCNLIGMNIYYIKIMKIDIIHIYCSILKGLLISIFIPSLFLLILNRFIGFGWLTFIIKVIAFCLIYGFMLIVYGLNAEEKSSILSIIYRNR